MKRLKKKVKIRGAVLLTGILAGTVVYHNVVGIQATDGNTNASAMPTTIVAQNDDKEKEEVLDKLEGKNLQTMYTTNDVALLTDSEGPAAKINQIKKRSKVFVLGVDGEKVKVYCNGLTGYIPLENLANDVVTIFDNVNQIKYAKSDNVVLKNMPSDNGDTKVKLKKNDAVNVIGTNDQKYWKVKYNKDILYVANTDLMNEKEVPKPAPVVQVEQSTLTGNHVVTPSNWGGQRLSRSAGSVIGPSGKETYYNLNMSGVVGIMHSMGFQGDYWVREDGCKMLGNYIMVAANYNIRPRGTIVETSLGQGIVADTGGFASGNPTQIDVATAW